MPSARSVRTRIYFTLLLALSLAALQAPTARASISAALPSKSENCAALVIKLTEPDRVALTQALPKKIKLPHSQAQLNSLFVLAEQNYAQNYDGEQVSKLVKKIQDGRAAEISKKQYKVLKEYRKTTQLIRSTFYLFSQAHSCPAEFDDFVRYFGKLNGRAKKAADDSGFTTGNGQKAKDYADRTLAHHLAHHDDLAMYSVKLTTPRSFQSYAAEKEAAILHSVAAGDMTVVEYHDLRKWMRDFKILFDLEAQLAATPENLAVARYLTYLNEFLGDTKDEYKDEEDAAKEEKKRLKKMAQTGVVIPEVRATVDPEIRLMIEQLLSRLH